MLSAKTKIKATAAQRKLRSLGSPQKAKHSMRFFKCGPGEYGEGDLFLGVTVPELRGVAREFRDIDLKEAQKLLSSQFHEERLLALVIIVEQFKKADQKGKNHILNFYLRNYRRINNWDLVDLSAPTIVGESLNSVLIKKLSGWIDSPDLWQRRIAILATFAEIRRHRFQLIQRWAVRCFNDEEDLMHKAVGWMLREMGKRNENVLRSFLKKHVKKMPRTMLRYSIEKFSKRERSFFMTR